MYDGEVAGAVPGPFDRLTFVDHFRAAATLAHRLVDDYGIRPGDRVAIAMRNFPEWSRRVLGRDRRRRGRGAAQRVVDRSRADVRAHRLRAPGS